MIGVHSFVHDSIVADAHSQEVVLRSLDGFDQLAGWSRILGESVDCPLKAPAFLSGGPLEGSSCRAGELDAKDHRAESDS